MIKSRLLLLFAGLSLAGCGAENPGSDEEAELDLDTNVQAMTNIDDCATGTTPNATSTFPGTGYDFFTRPRAAANPGGPCGSNPRSATYVEFTAPAGHVIHFEAHATFVGTPLGFCGANSLVFKVEKFANGAFQLIHNETIPGTVPPSGTKCSSQGYKGVYSPDTTGRYRVRAVAPRWDGLVEEVKVLGDDQQD